MRVIVDDLIERALNAKRESEYIEFKNEFDTTSTQAWCEIVKDIVAISNSGGGVILFGLDNVGRPTGNDISSVVDLDPAIVTDKVAKYTGVQFSEFAISQFEKEGSKVAVIRVFPRRTPVVFSKPGTYPIEGGKQERAFSQGTVYFRHGAKSEPCTSEDLRKFLEREIDRVRDSWLGGIRKVVEAPEGSQVLVVPAHATVSQTDDTAPVRVVDDPSAPAVRIQEENLTELYPFNYRELTNAMRERYTDFLSNSKYHRIRKSLEDNPRYCMVRFLDPNNPNSSSTVRFSRNIFEEFDKHYTKKIP
jgi:hypothetical protein